MVNNEWISEAESYHKPGCRRLARLKSRLVRKGVAREVTFSPHYEADEDRALYNILGKKHGSFLVRVNLGGITQIVVIKTVLGERTFRSHFKKEWQIITS